MHMVRKEVGLHTITSTLKHRQSNLRQGGHMQTILKGLAHKSAFDVSSSFPVKLEMRCVLF